MNLLVNPSYIASTLAIANVLLLLGALIYVVPSYSKDVLKADETLVSIMFMVAIITSPSLGGIAGGIVTDKCIGSYTDKRALWLSTFVYFLFVLLCIPGPFINNFFLFFVIMWLAVFA